MVDKRFAFGPDDKEQFRIYMRMMARTDGAVIGSKEFVDSLFTQCRDRFGPKRKTGARKMRGKAAGASGAAELLWSARDLRLGIE